METITTDPQDVKRALRLLLQAIGDDPDREGLRDTPDRILRMWREIFRGYDPAQRPHITTFSNTSHAEEMVFDSGEYYSMCEHHVLPFFGNYYFAYLPAADGLLLGISKVARVVAYCAARLQLQERLARDIVDMLSEALQGTARGYAIVLRGQHLCKSMRGVRSQGNMGVSYFTGEFEHNANLRQEFLSMINIATK